jgi:hypothetical protein
VVLHYLGGPHVRLVQKVLSSIKMPINVDGHGNDRFSGCRGSQPVAYSRNAGGLQKHTDSITFIWTGDNFEQEVRKVVDTHVEVTSGSVPRFVAACFNHKVKRNLGTAVTLN